MAERAAEAVHRIRGSRVAVTFVCLVSLMALLVVADWGYRVVQVRSLSAAVEDSHVAISQTQSEFERIALLTPRRPGGLTEVELTQIRNEFSVAGAEGLERLGRAELDAQGIRTFPWQGDLMRAREEYLGMSGEWREFVGRTLGDSMELAHPRVETRDRIQAVALRVVEAVPSPDVFGTAQVLDSVLESNDEG